MSNKLTGFSRANHVGITVSNLEKSIAFYEALTGIKVSISHEEIGGERIAKTQGLEDTRIKYTNLHLDNLNIDILGMYCPLLKNILSEQSD